MPISFDESIPALAAIIEDAFGKAALAEGVVLRDSTGRLSFIAPFPANRAGPLDKIKTDILLRLGRYARGDKPILFNDEPGSSVVLNDSSRLPFPIGDDFCQLVDRRIVGAGWLDTPTQQPAGPPRIVFASVKGGVGRSTALAVVAADFARRGRNVLAIDIDLEAPGLGDLLLDSDRLPRLGTADFLVENGIGGITDDMLDDFVGVSALTSLEGGRVDVVPAFGLSSLKNPENILPKLARSMVDDISESGDSKSVAQQIRDMVSRLSTKNAYDAILVDSRAGLSELAAPAVLGLGASVLLFGTAQKQTIDGYNSLFAALRLLAMRDRSLGKSADWRLMFKFVHAKASVDEMSVGRFRDDLYEIFSEKMYDEDDGLIDSDLISFAIDDPSAPHWPLVIPFSQTFVDFDPLRQVGQLTHAFYEQAFRPFLNGLERLLDSTDDFRRQEDR